MATFSQWRAARKTSRAYWVHGPESVLRAEVISDIKNLISPGPFDNFLLWGSVTSPAELVDLLRQQPLADEASRLVHVKDADLIEFFDFLGEFFDLRSQLPRTHLILESPEIELPATAARFARKLQVVKCSKPNIEDSVKLVKEWSGLSDESSRNLLAWASGDIPQAWHMSRKIRLLGVSERSSLPLSVFRLIADEVPATFADALISINKVQACGLLSQISPSEVPGLCSLLELRLEQIEDLLDHIRSGGSLKSFRGVPGVPYVTAEKLSSSVAHYDSARIRRCRGLLTLVDSETRRGSAIGLLEVLTALW